jgi:type I restriction enzyme S subunit
MSVSSSIFTPLGVLPTEWELVHLRDITTKIGSGATPTGGQETYLLQRVRFALIRSQNVYDRRFDETGLAFLTDEQAQDLSNVTLKMGDILLNITGDGITFSRSCLVPERVLPAVVNQHVSIIRVDDTQADPGYILAYLTHPTIKKYIESFNAGGSRRAITKGHIESFVIPLPPLPTQHAIARILGSLDDKIELNRQMNETLEAMARAIFQSWFVDFDPVRAKAEGRQPAGMDAATAALFPDGFEEVDGWEVPRGWGVEPLDQIAIFLNGLALQNYPPDGEDFLPVIKIAQLHKGDTEGSDKASISIPSEYIIEDGDVLFSWSGSLEVVIWCGGKGALNQHLFKVTSDKFPKWYYYLWVLHHLPVFQLIAEGKATTMGHIQRHHLSEAMVLVPSEKEIQAMNDMLEPLINKIITNNTESRTLGEIRDTLLPKLMSGEIRVDNESF